MDNYYPTFKSRIQDISLRTAKTGLALGGVTIAAIATASYVETGSPVAAINTISHCVHGEDREFGDGVTLDETAIAIAANTAAMFAWSAIFETSVGRKSGARPIWTAIFVTIASYIIDYRLVPKRWTPGIEKRLSLRSILLIYAAMAATFAISPIWNRPKRS